MRFRIRISYACAAVLAVVALVSLYVWTTAIQIERDALSRDLIVSVQANQPADALDRLRRGANPTLRNWQGHAAIQVAAANRQTEIVRILTAARVKR